MQFLSALREVWAEVPLLYVFVYGAGNVVLQGLNWFWYVVAQICDVVF